MIRPIDEYSGKVNPVSSQYPDGKARNISAPGDGTGTPLDAKWLNDVFGVMQYLTAKAGITPSGTPENAETSQVFESMWKLLNARALTFNLTTDANYTLTADQNLYKNITITDTGVVLTAGRDIIVDTVGRIFLFTNSTAQTLTVKTLSGTGVAVAAGASAALVCDETNVVDFGDFSGAGLEIASTAEAQAGTNNTKAITPLRLRDGLNASGTAPIYACRAWVHFDGTGTLSVKASGNVSSVTDLGAGSYRVNFVNGMPDENFATACFSGNNGATGVGRSHNNNSARNSNYVQIKNFVNTDPSTAEDDDIVTVAVFR